MVFKKFNTNKFPIEIFKTTWQKMVKDGMSKMIKKILLNKSSSIYGLGYLGLYSGWAVFW